MLVLLSHSTILLVWHQDSYEMILSGICTENNVTEEHHSNIIYCICIHRSCIFHIYISTLSTLVRTGEACEILFRVYLFGLFIITHEQPILTVMTP